MAVSIGNVWDSTTDVLAGRGALIVPVAAGAFLLPGAVQAAVSSYGGTSPAIAGVGLVVAIVALVAALWGQLTIIGIASDPDATRHIAGRAARRRLPAALLVSLVLGVVAVVAVLPIIGALAASGFDFAAASKGAGGGEPSIGPGTGLFCLFYGLALMVAGLWLGARLIVLSPVVLHERLGIGAIGRSLSLTRGLTLKMIGTALLLLVVYAVAALAAQYVVFIPLRLLLGPARIATATWLGAIAAATVGAVFSTVVAVFTARLYAALAPVAVRA